MKAVIFAGGLGTRMSELTKETPKPMVRLGEEPILWHIMKTYSAYGVTEFIICGGYRQDVIKQYFSEYLQKMQDVTFDLDTGEIIFHTRSTENWKVTIVDTGLNTGTGGRLAKIKSYVHNSTFFCTYGDGVANINIDSLLKCHQKSSKALTITVHQPTGKLGVVDINESGNVFGFIEKPKNGGVWINAGFFVCDPIIFEFIENDHEMFEKEPMDRLVSQGLVNSYKHEGFWKPMDTLKDNLELNRLWEEKSAPWKIW